MRLFRKKSTVSSVKASSTKQIDTVAGSGLCQLNFEQYIGQTVTVFVNAGGDVGSGFTGILMGRSPSWIKLLILPSAPPACSLGNACDSGRSNGIFCAFCPFNKQASVGTIAIIPVHGIAAFIHNSLNSGFAD